MSDKILLYPGAFDPPHYGHLNAAIIGINYMKHESGYNKLLFVVTEKDNFGIAGIEAAEHRRNMLRLLTQPIRNTCIDIMTGSLNLHDTYDIINVVERIKARGDVEEVSLLVGADTANYMFLRDDYVYLAKKIKFVIINRSGYLLSGPLLSALSNIYYEVINITPTIINISSSAIRSCAKFGSMDKESTTKEITDYIKNNKLYNYYETAKEKNLCQISS